MELDPQKFVKSRRGPILDPEEFIAQQQPPDDAIIPSMEAPAVSTAVAPDAGMPSPLIPHGLSQWTTETAIPSIQNTALALMDFVHSTRPGYSPAGQAMITGRTPEEVPHAMSTPEALLEAKKFIASRIGQYIAAEADSPIPALPTPGVGAALKLAEIGAKDPGLALLDLSIAAGLTKGLRGRGKPTQKSLDALQRKFHEKPALEVAEKPIKAEKLIKPPQKPVERVSEKPAEIPEGEKVVEPTPLVPKGKGVEGEIPTKQQLAKAQIEKMPGDLVKMKPRGKEAWEMTQQNYEDTILRNEIEGKIRDLETKRNEIQKEITPQLSPRNSAPKWNQIEKIDEKISKLKFTENQLTRESGADLGKHKIIAQQALSKGKPVPDKVLADYPGLAKTKQPPPVETAREARGIWRMPTDQAIVKPEKFQLSREQAFSERTAKSIAEVETGKPGSVVDPIVVWKDPKDGQWYVLDGFSRSEGFKRAGTKEANYTEFKGTEAEAIDFALEANKRASAPELFDDVGAYRKARYEQDWTQKKLADTFGSDRVNYLDAYGHLSPRGKFAEILKQPVKEEFPWIKIRARWVGEMRKAYGDKLTNRHEGQIFDWLYKEAGRNYEVGKEQFNNLIEKQITRFDWDANQPLVMKRGEAPLTGTRARADTYAAEAKIDELKDLQKQARTTEEYEVLTGEIAKTREGIATVVKTQGDIFGMTEEGFVRLPPKPSMPRTAKALFYQARNLVKSKAAKDVVHDIMKIDNRAGRYSGTWMNTVHRTKLRRLNEKAGKQVADLMDGERVENASPKVKAVAKKMIELMDDVYDKAAEAGVMVKTKEGDLRPIGKVKKRLPRTMQEKIRQEILDVSTGVFNQAHKFVRRSNKDLKVGTAEYFEAIEKAVERIMSQEEFKNTKLADAINYMSESKANVAPGRAFLNIHDFAIDDLFNPMANLERERVAFFPQEWMERDARKVIPKYVKGAAKRISEVEYWGSQSEVVAKKLERVFEEAPKEYTDVEDIVKIFTGITERERRLSPGMQKLVSGYVGLEVGGKIGLGTATIPNAFQTLISTLRLGGLRNFEGAASLLKRKYRTKVRKSGAPLHEAYQMFTGYDPRTQSLRGRLLKTIMTASGFNPVNMVNKYMAAATARVYIRDMYKVTKGQRGKLTFVSRKNAISELEKLGIDYKKPLTEELILEGMYRFATDSQLQKNVLRDPKWMNDPRYRPFGLFKRFGKRQAEMIKDDVVKQLKFGNPAPFLRVAAGGLLGGELVQWARGQLKAIVSGDESKKYDPDDRMWARLVNDVAAAGTLGLLGDMVPTREGRAVTEQLAKNIEFQVVPLPISDIAGPIFTPNWGSYGYVPSLIKGIQTAEEKGIVPGLKRTAKGVTGQIGTIPRMLGQRYLGEDKTKKSKKPTKPKKPKKPF